LFLFVWALIDREIMTSLIPLAPAILSFIGFRSISRKMIYLAIRIFFV
jgi:hypothetical protein